MRNSNWIWIVVAAGSALMPAGCDKSDKPAGNTTGTQPAGTQPAGAQTGGQTKCPVMGGEIDPAVFVEYKGKKVYFCCSDCIKDFNKEPEKFVAKLPQFGGKEDAGEAKPMGT